MPRAMVLVRRGAQQPEGCARLTDCDEYRMPHPANVTVMAPKALAQSGLRNVLATQFASGHKL